MLVPAACVDAQGRLTAVLGAILLTGYWRGTVAIPVHAGHGFFPMLFPAFFGVLLPLLPLPVRSGRAVQD